MIAHDIAGTRLLDGIPAPRFLEGLSRLYELVLLLDADRRIVWMSDGLSSICGDTGLNIGQDVRRLLPKLPKLPKPEQVFGMRSQLRRDGYLANVRVEVNGSGGTPLPVEVNILPISPDEGEVPLYVVIARRVEQKEPPLRALLQAGGTPGAILASAPDAVTVVDDRGFVTYANRAMAKLVGTTAEQLLDRPAALLVANAGELETLIAALRAGPETHDQNLALRHGEGGTVDVSVSASSLDLDETRRRWTVLVLRDVTKRRSAESELARRNDELEHCVHTLAHDLRSPLVALLGFSRLLRQDYGSRLDDTGLHYIDRIEQAGRTMEDLIHDLLELSRIGQPGERRDMVDPRAVLLQLKAEFKPRLEATGIRLELPDQPPLLYCDRTRLYQVFSNLIGNAIDHMGPCEDPRITVEIFDGADAHRICVRDRGRGIDPQQHERIFDIFQSLGPAADGRRGTGIGLAIVKKIVDTHGGRIWVESEPGRGTAFYLTLPHR